MTAERLLAIAPHPDDEALAAGGLLRAAAGAGAAVKIIFLTNGEGNTLGHMRWKKKLFISPEDEELYGAQRQAEARRAMALAGVRDLEFWNYCDTGLFELLAEGGNELTARLAAALREFRPDTVIYPAARDLHRDHSAVSLMTDFALESLGYSGRRLRYVNHGAALLERDALGRETPAGEEAGRGKLELLEAYRSQFFLNAGKWRALCREPENFLREEAQYSAEFSADFQGETLVWVRSAFGPGRLNPAALYLVGADARGARRCYFGRLRTGGGLRLSEFSGRQPHAEVEAQPLLRGGGCYLKLPRALFPGCDRVFIKARRKLSFFDDAGFSRIMLGAPARPAPRTAAVIPCYNIAAQAAETVRRALPAADAVIAVDDGSTDGTGAALEALKAGPGGARLTVLRLPANRGKGGALAAGFAAALAAAPPPDLVAALDGDLQHHPEDLPRFAAAWRDGADFIVGRRAFRADAPLRSRIGNNAINRLAALLFPNTVADTQSGFRAFSRGLLARLAAAGALSGARYEAELGVLAEVLKADIRLLELDIPAIYLDRNRTSHFRPLADSARVALALLRHALRWRGAL